MNLVTPKVAAEREHLFNKMASAAHCSDLSSTTECNQIISVANKNLVTPKAGAKA